MDTDQLIEPEGGGLNLSRLEVENIAEGLGLVLMWGRDEMPQLHWLAHNGFYRATTRFAHKFGGWVGPRHLRHYHRELRLALGLPEGIVQRRKILDRAT